MFLAHSFRLAVYLLLLFLSILPFFFQRQMYPFNNYNMYLWPSQKKNRNVSCHGFFMYQGEVGVWHKIHPKHRLFGPLEYRYFNQSLYMLAYKKVYHKYGLDVPVLRFKEVPKNHVDKVYMEARKLMVVLLESHNKIADSRKKKRISRFKQSCQKKASDGKITERVYLDVSV